MRTFTSGIVLGLLMVVPVFANALSLQSQQQLATLAAQLVSIMTQISQAQAQGPAYLASSSFQQLALSLVAQLTQVQTQLIPILAEARSNPTPTYPSSSSNSASCPLLARDLEFGMQGTDVLLMQQFLARESSAAFRGSATGYFEAETMLAVQRFQAARGIVSYGAWNTTGYGRVGPTTRSVMQSVCASLPAVPLTTNVPGTIPGYVPPAQTTTSSYGSFTTAYGGSGEANSVNFIITAQPSSGCGAPQFTLAFGDGTQQTVSFGSSCSSQTQTIRHTYTGAGAYTARLSSGSFQSAQLINVPLRSSGGGTLSISAVKGTTSFSTIISATSTPGSSCSSASYTLSYGDGQQRSLDFSDGCSARTKMVEHTYSEAGTYTISVSDSVGTVTSFAFQATVVAAAGAGDPYIAALLRMDGTDGSTSIVDSAATSHTWSAFGNAAIDGSNAAEGTGSLYVDGSGDYITTGASTDFNLGANPFTLDFWFAADAFPAMGSQAALVQQANSSGQDSSFGGAGLQLFGDKLYFVGTIGGTTFHPYYNNAPHSGSLVLNRWYHAAVVRSGNSVTLYLDGVRQGSIAVTGSANASSNALTLGRFGDLNGNYFKGWIDEVRISKGTARWTSDFDALSLVSANPNGTPLTADEERRATLLEVAATLQQYYVNTGTYPTTGNTWYSSESGDVLSTNGGAYIPNLMPTYLSALPRDPVGGASTNTSCTTANWKQAYAYRSDGARYKLVSHCSSTGTWSSSDALYDSVRPTWAWKVCSDATSCAW